MSAQQPRAYTVRPGYVYTDVSGATARTYSAGEQLVLPQDVGDAAHQLERVVAAEPTRKRKDAAA